MVPGRSDEHAGQVLFLVLGAVDGQVAVVEVKALDGLGQAYGELTADRAHPQAHAVTAEPAGVLDTDEGGVADGRGRDGGQAQALVDRRADGAGLSADAGRRRRTWSVRCWAR
ncbi:hypothetical protein ACPCAC_13415 [Streptomyces lavendulocolor]|uniref:hypothetical protein n=1 Tax=Streptomyces lavendulocolor TaxID=67316 RepID=UPI003C2C86B4